MYAGTHTASSTHLHSGSGGGVSEWGGAVAGSTQTAGVRRRAARRRLVGSAQPALKHLDEERRAVPQHIEALAVRRRVQSRQVVGVHRRLRIENAELLEPQMVHHHEAADGVHAQR